MQIDPQFSALSNRRSNGRGFTLIEVLIALTISGLLIGFAVSQVGQIASERVALQERLAADAVAWNKLMEQYRLIEGWADSTIDASESSGSIETLGRSWDWELEAEATLGENFYRYQVEVFLEDDSGTSADTNSALLAAYFMVN